jgi:hypothetical protein
MEIFPLDIKEYVDKIVSKSWSCYDHNLFYYYSTRMGDKLPDICIVIIIPNQVHFQLILMTRTQYILFIG